MCKLPLLSSLCRECYSEPEAVYEKLKRAGMDLVTVTDHNAIDALESLRRFPDFFLSEEVTCRMPSGTEVHLGVYDLNERQHLAVQRLRNDLPGLLAYLREQDLLFSLNHAFSRLTGRRDPSDVDWFEDAFPRLEVLNGALPSANNMLAKEFSELSGKGLLAGSDAHTLISVGSAFTEVRGARSRAEFLRGLKLGRGVVYGRPGSYGQMIREVLLISAQLIHEKPLASLLLPLLPAIPALVLLNHVAELHFAAAWRRQVLNRLGPRREVPALGAPFASEDVGA